MDGEPQTRHLPVPWGSVKKIIMLLAENKSSILTLKDNIISTMTVTMNDLRVLKLF